ncbi:TPA: hypothetical protein ACPHRT_002392 [Vibrio alginolyticus]
MCSFGTPKHGGFAYLLGKMHLNYGGLGWAGLLRLAVFRESGIPTPVQFTTQSVGTLSGDLIKLLSEAIMPNTTSLPLTVSELVFNQGEKVCTTSLKVAEAFNKQHRDVIRKLMF